MDEDREPEREPGGDPPAPLSAAGGAQREHGPPLKPREEQRVRTPERGIEDRDRRDRGEQHDSGGTLVADQLTSDQRHGRQGEAREDERRQAQGGEPRPPALQEVLEPEVDRSATALGRDDVEDVPEREVGDAERQLLVDIQRRPPDRLDGGQDDERPPLRRSRPEEEPSYSEEAASACISGVSGALRYGCSSTTSAS